MMTTQQTIDVRELPPRERHPRIFAALATLAPGEALAIVNDHDPKPLRYQIEAEQPGVFSWEYVQQGPQLWQVAIGRQASAAPSAVVAVTTAAPGERKAGPQLDNRGLEPPEPMVRVLEALQTLPADAELSAQLDREPLLLYQHLSDRGFAHALEPQADGTYLLRVWHGG
jgi:uncharacterized protein (DUF2249 family)